MLKAAIVGGTGYGGAELIRLLSTHPQVELTRVSSIDRVGETLSAVHDSLYNAPNLVFEEIPLDEVAKGVDVVFLAMPHKVSANMAEELAKLSAKVVDLSGDYRLRDPADYAEFYGGPHPHADHLGSFTYGLPELNRSQISESSRVASPGCFATTIALGLLPLAKKNLLNGVVHTNAATGSSGSGAYASAGTHHPVRHNNLKPYKQLNHQHTPEIVQTLKDAGAGDIQLAFVPVSAPLSRGILATTFVQVPEATTLDEIDSHFKTYYQDAPFVQLPQGRPPQVASVKGSMYAEVGYTLGEPHQGQRTLLVTSTLDNLVKGGAGQAVQCMNLMLGLEESAGLTAPALWP